MVLVDDGRREDGIRGWELMALIDKARNVETIFTFDRSVGLSR